MKFIKRVLNLAVFMSPFILVTQSSCSSESKHKADGVDTVFKFNEDKDFANENLILVDSIQIEKAENGYVYRFDAGVTGYSSFFISLAETSKKLSSKGAFYRTNSYETMCLLPDSVLLIKLSDMDTIKVNPQPNAKIKFELSSQGQAVSRRPKMHVYPYEKTKENKK
jgi:hypothetical protein